MTTVSERQARLERAMRERAARGPMRHPQPRYCRHDQQMVQAIGPSPAWQWIAPTIGVVGFLVLFAIIAIDPFGLVALLTALFYIATLGPAIGLARRQPECPICGRETPYRTREEAEAAVRPSAAHAHR